MVVVLDARMAGPEQRGIGRYIDELIAQMPRSDDITVRVIVRPGQTVVGMPTIPVAARWYTLKEQWAVLRAMVEQRADIVHIPHINVPIGLSLLRIMGKGPTLVVTVHDLLLVGNPREQATTLPAMLWYLKYWSYRLVLWLALRGADVLIAVSQRTAQEIQTLLPRPLHKKIVVIPEGIAAAGGSSCTNDSCDLQKGRPYVLTVGSCYPHKRLDWVLSAMIPLWREEKELDWIHVGPSERLSEEFFLNMRSEEQQLFSKRPSAIHPVGVLPNDELHHRYAHAVALVYPSSTEGYGLPPVEALACGGRVVSCAVPSLEGVIVPPDQLHVVYSKEEFIQAVGTCWQHRHLPCAALTATPSSRESGQRTVNLYRSLYSSL
ncbi:glycosyltransferase [Candidatus Uhrbacteria bacterium]|nr:glycosyltransferase [Candidatus Uhrbacteria bacterium]